MNQFCIIINITLLNKIQRVYMKYDATVQKCYYLVDLIKKKERKTL